MKSQTAAIACLTVLASNFCLAQPTDTANDSKPSSLNVAGQQYPRVDSQLRATFYLQAPDAQKVRLHLDKEYDLAKDSNGLWSVTTTPQAVGFHYYCFKEGNCWCAFFGNDAAAPWREMPGIVRVDFDPAGKIFVAKTQPAFVLQDPRP